MSSETSFREFSSIIKVRWSDESERRSAKELEVHVCQFHIWITRPLQWYLTSLFLAGEIYPLRSETRIRFRLIPRMSGIQSGAKICQRILRAEQSRSPGYCSEKAGGQDQASDKECEEETEKEKREVSIWRKPCLHVPEWLIRTPGRAVRGSREILHRREWFWRIRG